MLSVDSGLVGILSAKCVKEGPTKHLHHSPVGQMLIGNETPGPQPGLTDS